MPNTPRADIPYPSGSQANDFAGDMQDLAEAADTAFALDTQGTFASRPAAGVAGRYYWATDRKTLYRDDGTQWYVVQSQNWNTWDPTITSEPGANWLLTVVTTNHKEFKIVGDLCHISYAATWRLTNTGGGTTQSFGVVLSLPLSAKYIQVNISADVQNGPGRAIVGATQDQLTIYPGDSVWQVDNFTPGRWVRIDGYFRILVA